MPARPGRAAPGAGLDGGAGVRRFCFEPGADGPLFDVLDAAAGLDQALDEHAGGDDVVRVQLAGLDDHLGLGDRHGSGGSHNRIEVLRGVPVDQVAVGVGRVGVDQGDVGLDGAFLDIGCLLYTSPSPRDS